jgi:electron transfer flavoprotein alpha subunit
VNNIFVYCELEDNVVSEVSLELLTKGKSLAGQLGCKLETIVLGSGLNGIEDQLFSYGADVVHIGDDKILSPYLTLPHSSVVRTIFENEKPQIALFGATSV